MSTANGHGHLSRDEILSMMDRTTEVLPIPEWNGRTVIVRSLTAAERDDYEAACFEGQGKDRTMNLRNLRARLVALSVIDADGRQLFTEADVVALGQRNAKPMDRIFEVAQRLSGISDKDVERLKGNS